MVHREPPRHHFESRTLEAYPRSWKCQFPSSRNSDDYLATFCGMILQSVHRGASLQLVPLKRLSQGWAFVFRVYLRNSSFLKEKWRVINTTFCRAWSRNDRSLIIVPNLNHREREKETLYQGPVKGLRRPRKSHPSYWLIRSLSLCRFIYSWSLVASAWKKFASLP